MLLIFHKAHSWPSDILLFLMLASTIEFYGSALHHEQFEAGKVLDEKTYFSQRSEDRVLT